MRMRKHARLHLLLMFIAGLAIGTSGCGSSSADGTTAEVNPNLGKNHKKTVRNHP
jgi:hypothetical protein